MMILLDKERGERSTLWEGEEVRNVVNKGIKREGDTQNGSGGRG